MNSIQVYTLHLDNKWLIRHSLASIVFNGVKILLIKVLYVFHNGVCVDYVTNVTLRFEPFIRFKIINWLYWPICLKIFFILVTLLPAIQMNFDWQRHFQENKRLTLWYYSFCTKRKVPDYVQCSRVQAEIINTYIQGSVVQTVLHLGMFMYLT